MGEPARIIEFVPIRQQRRDERTYTEPQVKNILYNFARDIERKRDLKKWRADRLKRFVETVFNFD